MSLPDPTFAAPGVVLETLRQHLGLRYRVVRQLGEGGMALVFLAHDLRHDREVAVKVLRPDVAALLGAERFLREIRIAAQLQHPGILALHDSGEAGGLLYYVMPYEAGETIRARLAKEGALPLAEALRLGQELADALAYAHEQQVVHRDIKPENILLTARGHAAIADFGVARALAGTEPTVTTTGGRIGSPGYMSPEQFTGASEVGPRSDVYALGCVVFEMLTGRAPYRGRDYDELMHKHCSAPVPSARKERREVPLAVDLAVRRAMAKHPDDRFASAADLGTALGMPMLTAGSIGYAALRWFRHRVIPVTVVAALAGVALFFGLKPSPPTTHRLRVAAPSLASDDGSFEATRLASALADDLAGVPSILVVASDEQADVAIVGSVRRAAGLQVSVRVVDARSRLLLGATADSALTDAGIPALARRLGSAVRVRLARYLDSLDRRREFRDEAAWRLTEAALVQGAAASRAVEIGAESSAVAAIRAADSLLLEAARYERRSELPHLIRARNHDQWAFMVEYLRQVRPDSAHRLPSPLAIRLAGLAILDSILTRHPDDIAALEERGAMAVALQRVGARDVMLNLALRDLQRATALDGRRARAWSELAYVLEYKGLYRDAMFAHERALAVDAFGLSRSEFLYGSYAAAVLAGDFSRAAEYCHTGLREGPENPQFRGCDLRLLSRTARSASDSRRAVALADSLQRVESNPLARVLNRLYAAQALARAGQPAAADLEAGPLPDPAPTAVLLELARLRELRHDRDSAIALARRAVERTPTTRTLLLHAAGYEGLRVAAAPVPPLP